MKKTLSVVLAACLAAGAAAAAPAHHRERGGEAALIARAVADPARPQKDRDRDAERKLPQVLAFIGVRPGDKIVDFMPGAPPGYWTIPFSDIVGPTGVVYQFVPQEIAAMVEKRMKITLPPSGSHPIEGRSNVIFLVGPVNDFATPEKVDIVWTAQNYHDLHDPFMGPANMLKFDKAVYASLKPGGYFIIEDHRAPAGSGVSDTNTLHRIDPAAVKREVEAAGFRFAGSTDILVNPNDPLTNKVFDPSIRGHTSQFIFKFRKP